MTNKGEIRQFRHLATLEVRRLIAKGKLPTMVVAKKKKPKLKGQVVCSYNEITKEEIKTVITATSLEKIGLLNPKPLQKSLIMINTQLLYDLGFEPRQSKKRLRRIEKEIYKVNLRIGKRYMRDGMNCKEWVKYQRKIKKL